jgi:phospholipase/carboxylesterase
MQGHKPLVTLILGALLVFPALAWDEPSASTDVVTLWHEAKALVPTQVILPPDFDSEVPHSLIIALHGYGSSAEAFANHTRPFTRSGYILAVPEAAYAMLDGEGKLVYDWWLYQMPDREELHQRAIQSLVNDHLPAVIRDLRQRYRIDQVYILGFSQGAMTAYLAGICQPALFDGIVAFGGMTRKEWYPGDTLAQGQHVPVLILHGKSDTRMPFSEGERARDLLMKGGYDVTFRPFSGGHTVPSNEFDFVVAWLRQRAE